MNIQDCYCNTCKRHLPYYDAQRNKWKCPTCGNPAFLKVLGKDQYFFQCRYIPIEDIKYGDLIVIDPLHDFTPSILNIEVIGNQYFVALKGYRRVGYDKGTLVPIVDGCWGW